MSELEEKLALLKQKRDHVDLFGADDVDTLVEGIEYAMSHGGGVSVAVTPVENGYKITITDSEDNTQDATVQNGGDAYAVYVSTVPQGQTPMNKTEWLASLKGADGADGQDGAPGINAVNPFKGYYPSGVSLPATGAVGDYLYAPPSDSQSTATATIWHYDSTQTPPWTDTEIDVSAVVGVEFGSGQAVTATKIKNENGEEVTGPADVLSAEAGVQLNNNVNNIAEQINTDFGATIIPSKTINGTISNSNTIVASSDYVINYIPVSEDEKYILRADSTDSSLRRITFFSHDEPALGVSVDTITNLGNNSKNGVDSEKTAPYDGYLCVLCLPSAGATVTFSAYPPVPDTIGKTILEIDDKIVAKGNTVIAEGGVVTGLTISTTNIIASETYSIHYYPIERNKKYGISGRISDGYFIYGCSTQTPAANRELNESILLYKSQINDNNERSITPPYNGYLLISVKDGCLESLTITEIRQEGIGKTVAELGVRIDGLNNRVDGIVRPPILIEPTASISYTNIPIEGGEKYKLHIDVLNIPTDAQYTRLRIATYTIDTPSGGVADNCSNVHALFNASNPYEIPEDFFIETDEDDKVLQIYGRFTVGKTSKFTLSEIDYVDVFNYNSYDDCLNNLINMRKTGLKGSGLTPTFTLLHFSDIHADAFNLKRVIEFKERFGTLIDDIIHTGDSVGTTVNANSFDFWDNTVGTEKILNVIGNHDNWYSDGFTHDTNYPYTTYIKPYINSWGSTINQPDDAELYNRCYYYKDYQDQKIRLIVLQYITVAESTEHLSNSIQLTWLQTVLSNAYTNGYNVIIAYHYPNQLVNGGFITGFNAGTYDPVGDSFANGYKEAVDDFIQGGGKFVCWITGHRHRDYCGLVNGTEEVQVLISINCAACRNDEGTRAMVRNTKSQEAFNVMSVNTNIHTIQVFRVGLDRDALLRPIKRMCIDYVNGELIHTD